MADMAAFSLGSVHKGVNSGTVMHAVGSQGSCPDVTSQALEKPSCARQANLRRDSGTRIDQAVLAGCKGSSFSRQNTETLMEGDVCRMVGAANLHSGMTPQSDSSEFEPCMQRNTPSASAVGTTPPSEWGAATGGTSHLSRFTLGTNTATPLAASAFTPLGSGLISEGSVGGEPALVHTHSKAQNLLSVFQERQVELELARTWTMSSAGTMVRHADSDSLCMSGSGVASDKRMHLTKHSRMHASQPLADGGGDTFARAV